MEPPPVKPPGVDIFLNPASKVVMVVMVVVVAMVVMVVTVVMVAMVMMAMVIAMEVMVIDKFQNICQQGGDGFDDGVDMLLSLANRIGGWWW